MNSGNTITTGSNNTCLGFDAEPPTADATNTFTLGNANISNLRCADTTISSLSDQRDKKNIVDIPVGLDFINSLHPVQFDWDARDGSRQGRKDFGFIAQELDAVEEQFQSAEYTRLVHKDNPDAWEADVMKTYPILIKAIQDLSAKVDYLQAKIDANSTNNIV
jgi:hypothetical protein